MHVPCSRSRTHELSYLAWDKENGVACKQSHKYWVNKNVKLPSPVKPALFSKGGKCSIAGQLEHTKSPWWGNEKTENVLRTG